MENLMQPGNTIATKSAEERGHQIALVDGRHQQTAGTLPKWQIPKAG